MCVVLVVAPAAHLASPQVDLETHITDVISLIEFEDLRDDVLLGHSYSGIVVTGAADRIPERIDQLVYLDSGPVPDGLAFLDMQPPEVREHTERELATHGDGWRLPMPSWDELENVYGASLEGLDAQRRELMRSRAVAQPFGTYTQPLRLANTAQKALPKLLITNSFPLAQVKELIASEHPRCQARLKIRSTEIKIRLRSPSSSSLDTHRGGEVVTYARVVMGHQKFAIIEEAIGVGTSPWPLSVLFSGRADPSRLSCLLALRERPRTVREIPAATDLSQLNVSKLLSCLRESSLVRAERSSRFAAYGIADLGAEALLGVEEALLARIGGRPDREGGAR